MLIPTITKRWNSNIITSTEKTSLNIKDATQMHTVASGAVMWDEKKLELGARKVWRYFPSEWIR
jgi:hypothetical protein